MFHYEVRWLSQTERPAKQKARSNGIKRGISHAKRFQIRSTRHRGPGFMNAAMIAQRIRLLVAAFLLAGTLIALGGCANSVVDNCPDVKRDNPSTLQGKSPGGQ